MDVVSTSTVENNEAKYSRNVLKVSWKTITRSYSSMIRNKIKWSLGKSYLKSNYFGWPQTPGGDQNVLASLSSHFTAEGFVQIDVSLAHHETCSSKISYGIRCNLINLCLLCFAEKSYIGLNDDKFFFPQKVRWLCILHFVIKTQQLCPLGDWPDCNQINLAFLTL